MIAARMAKLGAGWLALLLVVAIVSPTAAAARSSTTETSLGKAFQDEVHAAWQALPRHIRAPLEEAGWQVVLTEFVVDAAPELTQAAPRGWPSGTSWRQTDAVHLPKQRKLILAEKRWNAQGEVVYSSRCAGVLRHELGHAYDLAQGGRWRFLSATPQFLQSYQADVAALPKSAQEPLAYYLQAGAAGRQETFAEAFGIALGGGSDAAHAELFQASFPRLMSAMRAQLQLTRPDLAAGRSAESRRLLPSSFGAETSP